MIAKRRVFGQIRSVPNFLKSAPEVVAMLSRLYYITVFVIFQYRLNLSYNSLVQTFR